MTMPEDHIDGDAFVVTWTGVDTHERRVLFEPRDVGGHTRTEQRQTEDGVWVDIGAEIVTDVNLVVSTGVIQWPQRRLRDGHRSEWSTDTRSEQR